MAPEQLKGGAVTLTADIYSLGCCLYHALTGEPPFQGGGPKEVLMRRLNEAPPDSSKFAKDIPKVLVETCTKMMARDPAHRFQTYGELMVSWFSLPRTLFGRG